MKHVEQTEMRPRHYAFISKSPLKRHVYKYGKISDKTVLLTFLGAENVDELLPGNIQI